MGELNISQQPTQLPPNMPDMRTAQRLLDVLSHLEQALRMAPPGSQGASAAPALEEENARLKASQTQALQRLESLIGKLQQQSEDQPAEQAA